MYKSLIENYIKKLSFSELDHYITKNYPNVSMDEKKTIYYYLKNKWQDLYNEDIEVLKEVKEKVSSDTYQEILKLLNSAYQFKNR